MSIVQGKIIWGAPVIAEGKMSFPQLFLEKDAYYVNKIIYIAEYLEGGLSNAGRALRLSCPKGGMDHSRIGLDRYFPIKERMKRAILYVCYSRFAKVKIIECFKNSKYPLLIFFNYIPGMILYLYWKKTVFKGIMK